MKAVRIVPALLAAAWLTKQTEVRPIDGPERRDRPERPVERPAARPDTQRPEQRAAPGRPAR